MEAGDECTLDGVLNWPPVSALDAPTLPDLGVPLGETTLERSVDDKMDGRTD